MHPFQLSYYNLLVGGLWGADRLGLEVTYWGDSVDRGLLRQLAADAPKGACAVFAPSLYETHAAVVENEAAGLLRGRVRLEGDPKADCGYLVVYNRKAYLEPPQMSEELRRQMRPDNLLFETRRQGTWLAKVYRLSY
jgi:hypothetical protein